MYRCSKIFIAAKVALFYYQGIFPTISTYIIAFLNEFNPSLGVVSRLKARLCLAKPKNKQVETWRATSLLVYFTFLKSVEIIVIVCLRSH
jgi:hypothetical protein